MWSFDKVIIVLGVLATLIVAISPIVIELIRKRREDSEMEDDEEPLVVQGMQVDPASDFVAFLKAELQEEKKERTRSEIRLRRAENKTRRAEYELRLAHDLLRRHNIEIPIVYRVEQEDEEYIREL